MTSEARAAQQYFDPPDPEPTCDICEGPMLCCDDWTCPGNEWNGETGCHVTCEERQKDEDDGRDNYKEMGSCGLRGCKCGGKQLR